MAILPANVDALFQPLPRAERTHPPDLPNRQPGGWVVPEARLWRDRSRGTSGAIRAGHSSTVCRVRAPQVRQNPPKFA
jgi:hypothetical protein